MSLRIILASRSPRRSQLLRQADIPFEVRVSGKESSLQHKTSAEEAMWHAEEKAQDIAAEVSSEGGRAIVIGADTVVDVCGRIMGKPSSEEDAAKMLRMLSGRTHEVITGVCLILTGENGVCECRRSFYETTKVSVRELTETEIAEYIATGESMDKAGAYGIQGRFAKYVTGICGDYYNVVGLPLCRLCTELDRIEV